MDIKKIAILASMAVGLPFSVQASNLEAADSSIATELCLIAASGNRAAMFNVVKESGKSLNFIANNITCNGENILAFVEQRGKNSQNMLKVLDRSAHEVSITDIAKNTLK
ncbi:MAG: DUF3718 domain-containing protein [Thalassotalea sp.]|nr:DUF3718 domain-containing protein [Thalassotalea sp.]